MLSKEVGPPVTDAAVQARYDQEIAGKPGEEEVHARHILVENEAEAKKIIAELKGGADFAALAKQYSKDPAARSRAATSASSRRTTWCRNSPPPPSR